MTRGESIKMELIWDFDGTLFDTYPLMAASLQQAMQEEGHEVPIADIRMRMAVTLGETLRYYKKTYGITDQTIKRYTQIMYGKGERAAKPFEGAEALCARIVQEGGHNHLCTHRGASARMYMDAWGISRYFEVYVTEDDGLARKPAPDMVQRILDKTGRPRDTFMMLGDRELDILAAQAAGVKGCRFTAGEKPETTAAEYTIEKMADFFDVVRGSYERNL